MRFLRSYKPNYHPQLRNEKSPGHLWAPPLPYHQLVLEKTQRGDAITRVLPSCSRRMSSALIKRGPSCFSDSGNYVPDGSKRFTISNRLVKAFRELLVLALDHVYKGIMRPTLCPRQRSGRTNFLVDLRGLQHVEFVQTRSAEYRVALVQNGNRAGIRRPAIYNQGTRRTAGRRPG